MYFQKKGDEGVVFFQNPEIRRGALFYVTAGAAAWLLGRLVSPECGAAAAAACTVTAIFYFLTAWLRYRKIAALSRDIDRILHGEAEVSLDAYEEGELSILQSELIKMTLRLREQAGQLRRDKKYLADSIADISHQIRTPLTSVELILSFLAKPELSVARRMELTKELSALLARIDWLISSLLKMSRLDAGTAKLAHDRVSVQELIRKAAEPLLIPIELRAQTLSVCCPEETAFTGDLQWSVEAVGNILKNCMEHTPEGGEITATAVENALYTELRIADNGPGIDKEDLPHLFERFYKGRNAGEQSVGIGLALARMIVEEQNGALKAENLRSGGAAFTIRFYKGTV